MKYDNNSYEQWKADRTKELVDGAKAVTLFILLAVLVAFLR